MPALGSSDVAEPQRGAALWLARGRGVSRGNKIPLDMKIWGAGWDLVRWGPLEAGPENALIGWLGGWTDDGLDASVEIDAFCEWWQEARLRHWLDPATIRAVLG